MIVKQDGNSPRCCLGHIKGDLFSTVVALHGTLNKEGYGTISVWLFDTVVMH